MAIESPAFVRRVMNRADKYRHSPRIDMALCPHVMKSTQPLVKAIEPLCAPRLKIIEIGRGIIVLKSGQNGAWKQAIQT